MLLVPAEEPMKVLTGLFKFATLIWPVLSFGTYLEESRRDKGFGPLIVLPANPLEAPKFIG